MEQCVQEKKKKILSEKRENIYKLNDQLGKQTKSKSRKIQLISDLNLRFFFLDSGSHFSVFVEQILVYILYQYIYQDLLANILPRY